MPRSGWIFLTFLGVALSIQPAIRAAGAALAPKTYELGADNKFHQVEEPTSTGSTASNGSPAPADAIENPTLDEIEQMLAQKKASRAKKPVVAWIKANPAAPDRDRGLFLLSEMYNQSGDKLRAFYHLDELLDLYPGSRLFYPALEKQYSIADEFMRGYRRRFLGIPILTAEDEGIEIMFRIQERAPGSPIAERSLLRTADYYYDDSQFDLASDAYGAYARSYPRSPDVPRARLRQAYSSLAQFRGLKFDATPVINAKAQLEDIQAEYPEMAKRENVADVLERIDGILAARVAQTADFYRRTHQPRAAAYNLRYLIENYPDTTEAEKARKQLEKLPAWALEMPTPTGGRAAEEEKLRTPDEMAPISTPPAKKVTPLPPSKQPSKSSTTEPPTADTPSHSNP
jgi:outer membrane assembly lipoprotein YfiO